MSAFMSPNLIPYCLQFCSIYIYLWGQNLRFVLDCFRLATFLNEFLGKTCLRIVVNCKRNKVGVFAVLAECKSVACFCRTFTTNQAQ